MRIHVGGDHAAFDFKTALLSHLRERGFEVIDHGANEYDALDNYPEFCIPCAEAVAADPGSLGVVLGGSGNGEQIAANKVKGIRSALAWSVQTAQLAREHNNAQVISLGARMHTVEEGLAIIDAFIDTPFSGDERHIKRIDMLARYEEDGQL